MTIYDFFKDYNDKFYKMKDKLIEIKEAEKNFISLTGSKFNDLPKNITNKNFGFESQLSRIEKLIADYEVKEKEYLEERDKCMNEINKMKSSRNKTIIILFFIEKQNIKSVCNTLSKIYKLDYSIDYIKNLKARAIKEFENVTFCYEK